MYHTRNDMPERIRFGICELLESHLANTIDIATQAKHAHWNVKGPHFIALHELFDKIHEDFDSYADLVAERIVQLGGIAEGTIRMVATRSLIPEYPKDFTLEKDHISHMSHILASYSERIRKAIDIAAEAGDAGTADILTEVSRGADKYLWFVEAHLQERENLSNTKAAPVQ